MGRNLPVGLLLTASFVLVFGSASALADTFTPVSQTLHVSAHSDPGLTVTPPDQTAGAIFTSLSNSADANNTSSFLDGKASVSSTLAPNQLGVIASCSGGKLVGGAQASGSGSALATVSFPSDTQLLVASGKTNIYIVGSLTVKDSGDNPVYFATSDINGYPYDHSYQALNLSAGTYTFDFEFSGGLAVGTGGVGTAGFDVIPVPEPAILGIAALAPLILIRRRALHRCC